MLPIQGGLMTDWDPRSHVTWAVAMNGLSHEPCGAVRSIDSFLSEHTRYFTQLKQRQRPFCRPLTVFLGFLRKDLCKVLSDNLKPGPSILFLCISKGNLDLEMFPNSENLMLWRRRIESSSWRFLRLFCCHRDETLTSELISRVGLVRLNQYIYFLSVIVSPEVSGLFSTRSRCFSIRFL